MTTNQTFTNDASRQILVLAGHGTTGRRVVQRLRDRGHDPRVGSRSGEPPFDWNDPSTWAAALDGIGAVYLVYVPDLTFPGALDAVQAFSGLAVASAEGLAELFANVLDSRNATLGDGVQRALGRPPRRFDDFCARAARAGTWSAAISAGGS